ncbi:Ragulator complex protein lamtor2 [Gaertneriomyces sp. JEL0708]|nr:Ragulator complex protein lamtor2 [Gaertneriomyces sp. JEL0708]
MLKPKVVNQVLHQANTGGIQATLLLTPEGNLVSFAGGSQKDARIIAAVASNVWSAYERHGGIGANIVGDIDSNIRDDLKTLIVDCDQGKLSVAKASRMLLCLVAERDVEMGLLRLKSKKVREYLEGPLETVQV